MLLATGSRAGQQGAGSRRTVTTHYVAERSELPVCDLLARDLSLVHAFVAAVREPAPGAATHEFMRAALRSAGRVDDLALLDHSTDLHGSDASVRGFFGIDAVKQASAVMVGTGNTLETETRVERGGFTRGAGLAGLDRIRELAAQFPARQAMATPPAAAQRRNESPASQMNSLVLRARGSSAPRRNLGTGRNSVGPTG